MGGGYTGRIMIVDLGRNEVTTEEYPAGYAHDYLGGFGVNNRLYSDYSRPGVEPLSADNPVILGAGPMVGTPVPGSSRVMANSRLPLTGAVASASGSMGLGANMKWAGLDHVVLKGRASRPILLKIEDGEVELLPAENLWGKMILEATRLLWKAYPDHSVLAIGPAGENQAYSALAMIDASSTLGRGGLAAVLGSKNLKAMVIKGSGGVDVADPKGLEKLIKGLYERLEKWPMRDGATEFGMIGAWAMYAKQLIPYGSSEEELQTVIERFGPQEYMEFKRCRIACPSCFLGDKDELYLPSRGESVYSTSFLNAAIIGCAFMMRDAEEAASVLALLDDLGLDFMTLSNQAAFLLEMLEHGIISEADAEGIPMRRDADILRELALRVARRKGAIGEAFARGWTGAIEHFGEESRRYTMLVRNQDCLYDPRVSGLGTMEFEQIVSPRGPTSATAGSATYVPGFPEEQIRRLTQRMGAGDEALERIFSPPYGMNVGRLTRYSEDWFSLFSCMGICNRYQVNRFYHAGLIRDLLAAVVGVELEVDEMMKKAAASWELYREQTAREGMGEEEDKPPEAWFGEQPLWGRGGCLKDYFGNELSRNDLFNMIEDYHDERKR
ncbi:MAG: aldehyde ferredoxin oxidoreductase N-terminal domain-containing protein [Actinomycetota bacterium]|nr:aldehyde ferredoxin oxidoreductase N-terminal domain-containing protein [Actinomycetota bacterium]